MITENLSAYILAGGRSRRMGVDKLFLQLDGRSMLERALATCRTCFDQVKLVAGQTDKLASLGCPIIIDSPKAKGPMAGVIAALENCVSDHCFVTAADLPDLNPDIIKLIINRYRGCQYLGLLESNDIQPLCGIYHVSSIEVLYRFAHNDDYRMTEAVRELDYEGIALPDGIWRNINCPADLPDGVING